MTQAHSRPVVTATSAVNNNKEVHDLKTFLTHNSTQTVRISPLVIMIIFDAYARRPQEEKRAIGTLMGYMSEGNVIDIVDAFAVVHQDHDEKGVLMDQNYHRDMVALRQSAHPKEMVFNLSKIYHTFVVV